MREKIPNSLTILRLVLAIPTIALVCLDQWLASGLLFLFCVFTDFLDGYLARKWKVESDFGRTMDPFIDKLLILPILIVLMHRNEMSKLVGSILIVRDILMALIRRFYVSAKGIVTPAIKTAKIKTALQMMGIPVLLFSLAAGRDGSDWLQWLLPQAPLIMACLFSLLSFSIYLKNTVFRE